MVWIHSIAKSFLFYYSWHPTSFLPSSKIIMWSSSLTKLFSELFILSLKLPCTHTHIRSLHVKLTCCSLVPLKVDYAKKMFFSTNCNCFCHKWCKKMWIMVHFLLFLPITTLTFQGWDTFLNSPRPQWHRRVGWFWDDEGVAWFPSLAPHFDAPPAPDGGHRPLLRPRATPSRGLCTCTRDQTSP